MPVTVALWKDISNRMRCHQTFAKNLLTKKHGLDNADYMKITLLETCLDEIRQDRKCSIRMRQVQPEESGIPGLYRQSSWKIR